MHYIRTEDDNNHPKNIFLVKIIVNDMLDKIPVSNTLPVIPSRGHNVLAFEVVVESLVLAFLPVSRNKDYEKLVRNIESQLMRNL